MSGMSRVTGLTSIIATANISHGPVPIRNSKQVEMSHKFIDWGTWGELQNGVSSAREGLICWHMQSGHGHSESGGWDNSASCKVLASFKDHVQQRQWWASHWLVHAGLQAWLGLWEDAGKDSSEHLTASPATSRLLHWHNEWRRQDEGTNVCVGNSTWSHAVRVSMYLVKKKKIVIFRTGEFHSTGRWNGFNWSSLVKFTWQGFTWYLSE